MSYAEAMESAPHIYLSVLPWLPENTQLHSDIAGLFKHLAMIAHKEGDWEGARWVKSVGSEVLSVACSPDGRFFAARFDDGTVCIFNMRTCEVVGEVLNGHSDSISSMVFSPESIDCLCIWRWQHLRLGCRAWRCGEDIRGPL